MESTREKIQVLIDGIKALREAAVSSEFQYLYDEEERMLHVSLDLEQDADESVYADDQPKEGELLIHTCNGKIVGFSILDTDLGKED
ncbi:MAG: hypothetical protein HGB19_10170 [Chlorobiales bacterium]|jgi:hypothetical protein|nr:hypothetical protein [Chlorobiales bacterium]